MNFVQVLFMCSLVVQFPIFRLVQPVVLLGRIVLRIVWLRRDITAVQPLDTPGAEVALLSNQLFFSALRSVF